MSRDLNSTPTSRAELATRMGLLRVAFLRGDDTIHPSDEDHLRSVMLQHRVDDPSWLIPHPMLIPHPILTAWDRVSKISGQTIWCSSGVVPLHFSPQLFASISHP